MKRVFLIVLDSFGIGEMPDAAKYGDEGSNTLGTVAKSPEFSMPNMEKLGLFNIDGVTAKTPYAAPEGVFARMTEQSAGKDTTTGHWEIAGLISKKPMPTFRMDFHRKCWMNFKGCWTQSAVQQTVFGTQVIQDYGDEHRKTGALIVYTSADSVFQIAAHEDVVPVEELYRDCEIARQMLQGDLGVGRVIARPFIGTSGNYTRTSRRHDFSLEPPHDTMLDVLKEAEYDVIGVGKINDIFAGKGITEFVRTQDNADGIEKTLEYMERDFNGLCFVNLVDFDMLYGHRNDVSGYAKALTYFDQQLPKILSAMESEDVLMITADHGCDPGTPSTDHSREYTPFIMYGKNLPHGKNMGTRGSFLISEQPCWIILDCHGILREKVCCKSHSVGS